MEHLKVCDQYTFKVVGAVFGDTDTSVKFVDVETKKEFTIGYITGGLTEKIKLEKGHWYTVEEVGNIMLSPVNMRIE